MVGMAQNIMSCICLYLAKFTLVSTELLNSKCKFVAVVVINVADDDGNEGDNLQENIFHDNYILLFGKPLKVPRFLTRSVLQ